MGEPDLAFIRAEDKGKLLDRKAIIPLFNEYILRLCDIQNGFALRLESSFATLETRLDKAETLLCLLEKRLNRVGSTTVIAVEVGEEVRNQPGSETSAKPYPTEELKNVEPEHVEPENLEVKDSSMMKIRDHPMYEKYFKMLRLGIPEPAVKIKMSNEGIDPTLLSNPDKLVEAVKIPSSSSSNEESDSD